MKGRTLLLILLWPGLFQAWAQQPVVKTNSMKVYMHYMPWFETPETIDRWGWHWTMNNRNPNNYIEPGRRDIASHYYPLIGPYASRDKDVIEYHLLLMKLAGIDGVLINWYGVQGSNGDVHDLLVSANAIVSDVDDFGMEFGVILEDRFSRDMEDAKANVQYLKENYFNQPEYIRYGDARDPLVGIFGPITFQEPGQWEEILAEAGEDVEFLTLWYESGDAGTAADGEYAWVYQDSRNHLDHLQSFYASRAAQLKTVMGSAYPGFEDFYQEGGSGNGYFTIPHNGGATLDQTLAKLEQHRDKIDMVQLVTWNDFGEGTIIEPTVETGFEYLKKIQTYTGVSYGEEELALVHKLYRLRKQYKDDASVQAALDRASAHFANLEIAEASTIMESFALGLLEGINKSVEEGIEFSVYPNPVHSQLLHIALAQAYPQAAELSITDLRGKVVYEKKILAGTQTVLLQLPLLNTGLYFVRVQTDKRSGTQKLVLSR